MKATRENVVAEVMDQIEELLSIRRRAVCAQPLPRDVSLPQLYVLMTLQEDGAMTVSEMANRMRVSAPSASSLVDRMEHNGLACRTRASDDRRVVRVDISPEGRRVVEELTGMRRESVQRLLQRMTDEEMADVGRGLEAVRRAAERDE